MSFLPTAVTVMVTAPESAATAFATKNPNAKATVPVMSKIRRGLDLLIIIVTPVIYLHML